MSDLTLEASSTSCLGWCLTVLTHLEFPTSSSGPNVAPQSPPSFLPCCVVFSQLSQLLLGG